MTFGGVSLPPILHGVEPNLDLDGKPKDYGVKVIWANRAQIDKVLKAVAHEKPDLSTVVEVVNAFTCHLDSVRDHAKFGLCCAMSQLKSGDTETAITSLEKVIGSLGRWNDQHRLHLH